VYSASRNNEEAQSAVVFEDLDNFSGQTFQLILYVGGADSDEVSDPYSSARRSYVIFRRELKHLQRNELPHFL
jgi:hypothetical protein